MKKIFISLRLGCTAKELLGALQRAGAPSKTFYNIGFLPRCPKKNFSPFFAANPEIIEVKVCTDRQNHEILTQYTGVCEILFLVKICYLPARFACRGIN
jgi:hypothetical protein